MKVSKPGPKRILLFILIFVVPAGALYFLSKAHHDFGEPPFIGPYSYEYDQEGNVVDSTPYTVPDFSFTSIQGETINKKYLEDKYIIFTTIQEPCLYAEEFPEDCSIFPYHIEMLLYDELNENRPSFGDVQIISILTDSLGRSISISDEMKAYFDQYNKDVWQLVQGDPKQVYSFPINNDSLYTDRRKDGYLGNRPYLRTMLLIDKNHHIRGYFGGKIQAEIREFKDRLKVLKKVDKTTKEM